MTISTLGWIIVGVVAWLVVAAVLGVLIGRMIHNRDAHVPHVDPVGPDSPAHGIPVTAEQEHGGRRAPGAAGPDRPRGV